MNRESQIVQSLRSLEGILKELFPRSNELIQRMAFETRWETTRRHPYYLWWWLDAKRYRHRELRDPDDLWMCYVAYRALLHIGVHGEPVDPAKKFESVSPDGVAIFGGAVHPMTVRQLGIVLTRLPTDVKHVIGRALLADPEEADGIAVGPDGPLFDLLTLPCLDLDGCLPLPLFVIHMEASQRAIEEDVRAYVKQVANSRSGAGPSGNRFEVDHCRRCLQVWDRREGWDGSGYDLSREESFQQIASSLKARRSTVHDQWRKAFNLITGQEFSPEKWWRIIGPTKLSQLPGDPERSDRPRVRRRFTSSSNQPASEARLGASVNELGAEQREPVGQDHPKVDTEASALAMEVLHLFRQGLSDAEIEARTNFSEHEIAALRTRYEDLEDLASYDALAESG